MPEIPLGISFDQDDDGYVIRRKTSDGAVVEIKMSEEELYGLKGTIDLWSDRKMTERQVTSGSVQPIVVLRFAKVGLWPDAVQANVLLVFEGAMSGQQMTLEVPLDAADYIAFELPRLLATMREEKPIRQ